MKRVTESYVQSFAEIYPHYELNALVNGTAPERFQRLWEHGQRRRPSRPVPVMIR